MKTTTGMVIAYGSGIAVMFAVLHSLTYSEYRGAGPLWATLAGAATSFTVAYLLTWLKK